MNTTLLKLTGALLLITLAACGGSGGGGGGGGGGTASTGGGGSTGGGATQCSPSCTVSGSSADVSVSASGGTITYGGITGRPGESVVVTIPPAAVASDTTITITPTSSYPANADVVPSLVFDFTPDGQTFAVPITIVITYDPSQLGSVAEAELTLATVNSDGLWEDLPGTVDTAANTITAQVSHFSKKAGKKKDIVAPTVANAAPVTESAIHGSASVTVRFSESMKKTSLAVGGTLGGADATWSSTNVTNDTLTLAPTSGTWSGGQGLGKTLTVDATDVSGNALSTLTLTYEVDDTNPTAGVAPVNASTIAGGTQIVLTFDDTMNPASLGLTGTMAAASDGGAWTVGNTVLTVSPATIWGNNAQTLNVGASDNAGNPVTVNLSYTVDENAPTVSAVSPMNASTILPTDSIVITFSETMSTGSLALGGDFNGMGHTAVWSGGNTILTVSPTSSWTAGSNKTLTVNVSDFYGNPLTQLNLSYTVNAPDSSPPSVTVGNVRSNGVLHSGFLIGSMSDNVGVTSVEVSLDSGAYQAAMLGTNAWKFQVPIPSSGTVWRDNSQHTVSVRAKDAANNTTTIGPVTFRKGVNQDINGDGYTDVVVGAPTYSSTGRVYVFHSHGGTGITAGSTAIAAQTEADAIIDSEGGTDAFGYGVALGDVNGDGYADVIVGANTYSTSTGRVYVFLSRGSSGITTSATPVAAATEADSIITGEATNNFFGLALATGDVNGDGYADVIVGAWKYSTSTGRVYVFHSRGSTGITANATPVGAATEADSILTGETTSNNFGISVAAGDVTGDNFADVVVGAPGYTTNTGRVYVFHSRGASGVTANATPVAAATEADSILTGEATGDTFGNSVAVGDVTGDGFGDVIAGAPSHPSTTGRVYVFHSRGSTGVTANATPVGAATEADSILSGEAILNFFGASVTAGDVTGDGYADVVVGAYTHNSSAGRAYVFHSRGSTGVTTNATPVGAATEADSILDGEATNNSLSFSLSTGDVNGDGYMDVILGANGYSSNTGRIYVLTSFGSIGVTPDATPETVTAEADSTVTGQAASDFGKAFW